MNILQLPIQKKNILFFFFIMMHSWASAYLSCGVLWIVFGCPIASDSSVSSGQNQTQNALQEKENCDIFKYESLQNPR